MRITINMRELRRIIREELETQQCTPPGKWMANTGEPADERDLERLGEVDDVPCEDDNEDE